MENIKISTEMIRLDQLLKFSGYAPSGGAAADMIRGGGVSLNGELCTVVRKQLHSGDTVAVDSLDYGVQAQLTVVCE